MIFSDPSGSGSSTLSRRTDANSIRKHCVGQCVFGTQSDRILPIVCTLHKKFFRLSEEREEDGLVGSSSTASSPTRSSRPPQEFSPRSLALQVSRIRGLQRYVVYLCSPIAPSLGGWGGGGGCGVSANEYCCAHHVTLSPNKVWRSTSMFNLCF
jgi:hypothetical protein